jgi:hypothetical protein
VDGAERDLPRRALPPPLRQLIVPQIQPVADQPVRLLERGLPRTAAAENDLAAFDTPQRIGRGNREADQPGPNRSAAVRHRGGPAPLPRAATAIAIDGSEDAADKPVLPVRPVSAPPTGSAPRPVAPETSIDAPKSLVPGSLARSPRPQAAAASASAPAAPQPAVDIAADRPPLLTRREPPSLSPLDRAIQMPPDLTPPDLTPSDLTPPGSLLRRSEMAALVRPALPSEIVSLQQPQRQLPLTAPGQSMPDATESLWTTTSRATVEPTRPTHLPALIAGAAAAAARETLTPRETLAGREWQHPVGAAEPRGPTVEIGRVEIRVQAPKPLPRPSRVAARPHGIAHGLSFGAGRRW